MYTNKEKSRVIRDLIVNLGDVQQTAQQHHISERTVRRWKNDILRSGNLVYWDEDTNDFQVQQRYERIRVHMLIEIERLLSRMRETTPEQASNMATAVSRLTDRIAKIENILNSLGQYIIKIDSLPLSEDDEQDIATQRLGTDDQDNGDDTP